MTPAGRARRFLLPYALANAGGVVAYTPLLTLLLPVRMAALAGGARVEWLSLAALLGALSASLFNLLFGWASDRRGSRRTWAAAGLAATLASYAAVARADTPAGLVAAVVLFQAAVNLLLAPLAAWAADVVPDDRKGVLGGLIGAGPPAGALAGVAATLPALPDLAAQLTAVGAMVAVLTLPLLAAAADGPAAAADGPERAPPVARRDFVLLWVARLLVQTGAAALFAFLLFFFQDLSDPPAARWVARLIAAVLVLGFPVALLAGRASDRLGPRRPFLAGASAAMAAGLVAMAVADGRTGATLGYLLFGCGLSVFLPLQATFAMQLLPSPGRRGRDLGLLNLANTLPSVIAPLLAAGLVPLHGYPGLLWALAGGAAAAGACVLAVRSDRQRA